MESEGDDK
jgi:hypothetical protein